MQEVVEEKSVALVIKSTKLTGRLLAKAMRAFLRKMKENPTGLENSKNKEKPREISLNALKKQGACLENVQVTDNNVGLFRKVARDFNVYFALKRDRSTTPPTWYVHFKAKDKTSIADAFDVFAKKVLGDKERKPSLLQKLNKFKEFAKSFAAPVKSRNRGGHEL